GSVRGHGESKRKSDMLGAAWKDKKRRARESGTPYGKMCPAWLELADGTYRAIADRAAAVRKIFEWCAAGVGTFGILERLAAEQVPPFGRSGKWERSYVRKLLNSEAVRGIYQPRNGSRWPGRTPDGEPIDGYYPRVVSDRLWYAARAATEGRRRRSGRPSADGASNPFSGLLVDALDGSKLHAMSTHGAKYRYLVSSAAVMKRAGAEWRAFPLAPFVAAVLGQLRELRSAELFADPGGAKLAELTGRLADVEKR